MKSKTISVKKAIAKNLLKKGDEIWIKCTIFEVDFGEKPISVKSETGLLFWIKESEMIKIDIPEKKLINFAEAGRVLKLKVGYSGERIVMTTGNFNSFLNCFSAYVLKSDSHEKGYAAQWNADNDWEDITNQYKI